LQPPFVATSLCRCAGGGGRVLPAIVGEALDHLHVMRVLGVHSCCRRGPCDEHEVAACSSAAGSPLASGSAGLCSGVACVVAVGVCDGTGTLVGVVVTLAVFVLVLLWCCPACPMTRA
jgi:hypothetical protein